MPSMRRVRQDPIAARLSAAIMLAAFALAASCSASDSSRPDRPLDISPKTASVSVGGSQQFSVLNARGAATWTSSNDAVASVVSTGFATGLKSGTVTLTATDSRGSTTATLVVKSLPALALSASSAAFTQLVGAANPAPQVVQITDAGDDKVGTLSVTSAVAPGQPGGWLTTTLSGTTAPAQLSIGVAAGSLTPGTYSATVSVGGVGASNGAQSVVVTFTVATPPVIVLSSSSLAFSILRSTGSTAAQTVSVTNGGGSTLSPISATIAYAAGQPTGWLAATLGGTTAPATLTVTPTLGALADGTYSATISVAAPGATNTPRPIAVTLVVGSTPVISLSNTTLAFAASTGGPNPASQTSNVTNVGGGTLSGLSASVTYGAGQPTGWLAASVSPASAPSVLTVQPTVGALAIGTYTATVSVASSVAGVTPATVNVTFTVSGPINLVVGTSAFSVSALRGGASAPATSVAVTRQGGGTLSGLTSSVSYGSGNGWLSASLSATTTPTSVVINANSGALAPGTYTGTVTVASPGATNGPQTITVTFNVLWSFSADVYPQIAGACTACHFAGGNTPNLSTASAFYGGLVNVGTSDKTFPRAVTHPVRIVPGSAGTSYVIDQINKVAGAYPMPPGASPVVSATAISRLIEWINQGAPNN